VFLDIEINNKSRQNTRIYLVFRSATFFDQTLSSSGWSLEKDKDLITAG